METGQTPELIFSPRDASQPPPTHSQAAQPLPHARADTQPFDSDPAEPSFSSTPSPAREQIVRQPEECGASPTAPQCTIAPQGAHPIPTGDSHDFLSPPSLSATSSSRLVSYDTRANATVNSLPATSDWACTAWTSERSAFAIPTTLSISDLLKTPVRDAETIQVDRRKQVSAQRGFLQQQSPLSWELFQQKKHRLVSPRPQFQLTTQRRVPDTTKSIVFALNGNIDGLRDLFSRGLASPWDVSDSRGFSLMRVGFTTLTQMSLGTMLRLLVGTLSWDAPV
jgi:hypothetical protein